MQIFNPLIFLRRERVNHRREELRQLRPVVIMARGHSGTRVLAWICHYLHISMWSDENRPSGDTNRRFNHTLKKIARQDPFITRRDNYKSYLRIIFEKAVHQYYESLGRPADAWGWKFPETYLLAPLVRDTFPHARYIHLIRDGRDIAFKNHTTDDSKRKIGKRILGSIQRLDSAHHIQSALSWKIQVEDFLRFEETLEDSQVKRIYFEDLCLHPHEVVHSLTEFLNVSMTKQCANYLNDGIRRQKVAQYHEENRQKVLEVQDCIGETLHRLNYKLIE